MLSKSCIVSRKPPIVSKQAASKYFSPRGSAGVVTLIKNPEGPGIAKKRSRASFSDLNGPFPRTP